MSTRATATARKTAPRSRARAQAARPPLGARQGLLYGALVVVAAVALYFPVIHHPFVNFDDPGYVANNAHIAGGLDWATATWAFTTFEQSNWHPLTWLSHALDVQLFRLEPGGHHAMNLLLHAANVLLLFWVLWQATGRAGRSAFVAALFALHPINVESVAWISERKNLLSMLFFLLGLGAYGWYVSARRRTMVSAQAPDIGRYLVMTLCFALGLMAKPQIITFPFILLLWDYWPLRRMRHIGLTQHSASLRAGYAPEMQSTGDEGPGEALPARALWWLVKEKIPLFAICGASAVVTMAAQRAGGAVASLQRYPLSVRLTNAVVSYTLYIGKALWPSGLAPLYPHPWQPLPLRQVVPSLLALLAITALVVSARRRRYLLVGWLWFLGALVPMSGIVQVGNQAMADRYAYLPFIGLFIMICWGAADLAEAARVPVTVLHVVAGVVLVILAFATNRQIGYWADNVNLWQHTLAVTQGNYIAHDNLAGLLMGQGRTDEAVRHYRAALAIYPADPFSNLSLAVYEQQHGNFHQAIEHYDEALRITAGSPQRAELLGNEGLVYLDMGDKANAQACFARAVNLDPKNAWGWLGLGLLAETAGDWNTAIDDYKRANSVRPLKAAYVMLARVLEKKGDAARAEEARERGKLLPGNERATQTFSGGILQK